MRLDEKPAVGRLQIDLLPHTPDFSRKPFLVFEAAHMFNNAVGEYDVKTPVREVHLSSVPRQAGVALGNGRYVGRKTQVEQSHRRLNRYDPLPVVNVAAHIQDPGQWPWPQRFQEYLQPLPSEARLDKAIEFVDAKTHGARIMSGLRPHCQHLCGAPSLLRLGPVLKICCNRPSPSGRMFLSPVAFPRAGGRRFGLAHGAGGDKRSSSAHG